MGMANDKISPKNLPISFHDVAFGWEKPRSTFRSTQNYFATDFQKKNLKAFSTTCLTDVFSEVQQKITVLPRCIQYYGLNVFE